MRRKKKALTPELLLALTQAHSRMELRLFRLLGLKSDQPEERIPERVLEQLPKPSLRLPVLLLLKPVKALLRFLV